MATNMDGLLAGSIRGRSNSFTTVVSPNASPELFRWIFRHDRNGNTVTVMTLYPDSEPRNHLSPDYRNWHQWTLEGVYRERPGQAPERISAILSDPMDSYLTVEENREYHRLRAHPSAVHLRPPESWQPPRIIRDWMRRASEVLIPPGVSNPAPQIISMNPQAPAPIPPINWTGSGSWAGADSIYPSPVLSPELLTESLRDRLLDQIATPPSAASGSSIGEASGGLSGTLSLGDVNIADKDYRKGLEKPKVMKLMGLIDTDYGTSKILGIRESTPSWLTPWVKDLVVVDEFRELISFWPQSETMESDNHLLKGGFSMKMMIDKAINYPGDIPNRPFMCTRLSKGMGMVCFFKNREDFLQRHSSELPPSLIFYVVHVGGADYIPVDPTETVLSLF